MSERKEEANDENNGPGHKHQPRPTEAIYAEALMDEDMEHWPRPHNNRKLPYRPIPSIASSAADIVHLVVGAASVHANNRNWVTAYNALSKISLPFRRAHPECDVLTAHCLIQLNRLADAKVAIEAAQANLSPAALGGRVGLSAEAAPPYQCNGYTLLRILALICAALRQSEESQKCIDRMTQITLQEHDQAARVDSLQPVTSANFVAHTTTAIRQRQVWNVAMAIPEYLPADANIQRIQRSYLAVADNFSNAYEHARMQECKTVDSAMPPPSSLYDAPLSSWLAFSAKLRFFLDQEELLSGTTTFLWHACVANEFVPDVRRNLQLYLLAMSSARKTCPFSVDVELAEQNRQREQAQLSTDDHYAVQLYVQQRKAKVAHLSSGQMAHLKRISHQDGASDVFYRDLARLVLGQEHTLRSEYEEAREALVYVIARKQVTFCMLRSAIDALRVAVRGIVSGIVDAHMALKEAMAAEEAKHDDEQGRQQMAQLDRAIRLDPKQRTCYILRAQLRDRSKEVTATALEDYNVACNFAGLCHYGTDASAAFMARAEHHEQHDRLNAAVQDLTRAIELNPASLQPRRLRGAILCKQTNWRAAIDDLTTAIDMADHQVDAHFARATARYHLSEPELAVRDLTECINSQNVTFHKLAYELRCHCFVLMGAYERAASDGQTAVALGAEDTSGLFKRLARLLPTAPSEDAKQPIAPSNSENDSFTCKICRQQKRSVLFLPCSHWVACGRCSDHLKSNADTDVCPVCRHKILLRRSVYIP